MGSSATEFRATAAPTLLSVEKRYQLAVSSLRQGMFVAELDRPWLDTPFLLQGFLIDSKVELDTLIKYCKYVYIDLQLSNAEVADAIRIAEMIPAPKKSDPPLLAARREPELVIYASDDQSARKNALDDATTIIMDRSKDAKNTASTVIRGTVDTPAVVAYAAKASSGLLKPRADVAVRPETRDRFREFVKASAVSAEADNSDAGVLERAWDWLRSSMIGTDTDRQTYKSSQQATRDSIKAWLPPEVELTSYADVRAVEKELPRARSTFSRGEEVLKDLVTDVKAGRVPEIAEVSGTVDDIVESMVDNPDALMWVARLREEDLNTYHHGVKVALYLVALGRHLGFPKSELSQLGMIGMLADIGKTRVPRTLLEKPGMLTPAEFSIVKDHVQYSLDSLGTGMALPSAVLQGIAQHHERLDGSGYPKGLKGGEIGIYGRLAAIADCFAALITPRPYANPSAPQDAMMNLYEWAGTSFHEPLIEQFVQAVGVFPVGSLAELSNGEVAVIVAHNRVRRLEPKVLVLTSEDKSPLHVPIERDLLQQSRDTRKALRIIRGLPAGAYGLTLRDYYMGEIAKANGIPR